MDETTAIENPGTSGSRRQAGLQQGDPYPAIPMVQDKTAENDKVGSENKQGNEKKEEIDRKRLCNGEIYFIEEVSIPFRDTIRVSNSLYSDQARNFVGLDLDPNCLHRLSGPDNKLVWI